MKIKGLLIGVVGFVLGTVSAPLVHSQGGKVDGKVTHIGFAVRDLDKSSKEFAQLLGQDVPTPIVVRDTPYGPIDSGKKMNVRVVHFPLGAIHLELLQGVGESLWNDFIARRGEGFHHIAISVPDSFQTRDVLLAKGGQSSLRLG